jgi:hypothetical protein
MPRRKEPDVPQQRSESPQFESGWSEADFAALEMRWSFLTRLGERKADKPPQE